MANYHSAFAFEATVSFQVTVLKVLAGHPDGRLSVDDLKRSMAILISSGPEWTDRSKRLLARAPGLDIFGQSLVIRDDQGWQITEAGRALLAAIESPAPAPAAEEALAADEPMYSTSATPTSTRRRETSRVASPSGQPKKTRRVVANLELNRHAPR